MGRFFVGVPSGHIRCLSLVPGVSRSLVEETLLGPPLALSLALRDVWCLHASAVMVDDGAVLILGDSGRGKSTLAAYGDGRDGCVRIADDILPCSLADGAALAHPHFPQLKLAAADQYPVSAPRDIPIRAFVFLASCDRSAPVELVPVGQAAAVKRLAEQTVALGLFDASLRTQHLAFACGLLASAPAFELRYPHAYHRLPDAWSQIVDV